MTNGPNVLSARGDEWKWRRKALVPYFQPRAVNPAIFPHLKDLAARNADAMLTLAESGKEMDVDKETGLLTLDVICLYLFGYPTAELDVSDLGEGGARNMSAKSQTPQLLLPVIKSTKWAQRNVDAVRGKLQSFINKAIEKSTLLSAADIERLGFTTITHNLPGHDTTAHTFTFLLGHLAQDPKLQESLVDEIHRAFGPSPIDWSKLCISDFNQLKFATCVIRENLRLHAVAPGGLLTCVKDSVIAGIPIPAGTDLIGNYYGIARDPEYFPDPEAFKPERWALSEDSVFQELTGDVSDMTTKTEAALPELSFALGAHACLGRNLALIEMRVLLAMIIERVVIRPSANTTLEAIWVLLVTPKNGMNLSFSAHHG
ncbi:hypothetical protein BZG36_00233 [Bifiguratus adelaidae]|uniref:Cytochrome P450 n=1 Tax=Bifiguratus adelaidae TaxID=1938954 RepID=A0A261Y8B9_9FUNG|nr:hypothetical protein BZG36_00233 [Bifiguratus adelaidae]